MKKVLKRVTVNKILKMKGREKIVMVTAYDALFAKLFMRVSIGYWVGDSLNMSFPGGKKGILLRLQRVRSRIEFNQN